MNEPPFGPFERQWSNDSQPTGLLVLAGALLIGGGLLAGILFKPFDRQDNAAPAPAQVSELVYPAATELELTLPVNEEWLLPSAAATAGGLTFVLDAGHGRILGIDSSGVVTYDSSSGLELHQPMAIATDGRRLFVADSLAGQVLVLDLAGKLEKVIHLPGPVAADEEVRPIGVAVAPDGRILVSDAGNHRVLFLDADGSLLNTVGAGMRAEGSEGFNVPGALTVDAQGNVYVVDTLNGRVVKLSPDGQFIRDYGRLGGTAGTLSRPKGVAVDGAGRVFVSDGLLAAVEVFSAEGAYLGVIGRRDPGDPTSGPLFQAPAGLWLDGDRLYVTDRFAGLVTFSLAGAD